MDKRLQKVARSGFVAKGIVYAITGILTFMSAFNLGGENASKLQVLEFLDKQIFGNVLLILMGLGLTSYAAWRFIEAVSDPEGTGNDIKAKIQRGAFFYTGLVYLGLAGMAFWRVIGSRGGSGNDGSANTAENSSLLASEAGLILIGIVGGVIIISGVIQFVRVYQSKFIKKFDLKAIQEEKRRKSIKNTAKIGLSARGVIFLIIGYFALHAAFSSNPSEIKTTSEVFSFIEESSYGAWLLGLVAAGLIAYAAFMFLTAKYRKFRD